MSAQSPLLEIWEASAAQPYYPSVSKNAQFIVGFSLLLTGTRVVPLLLRTLADIPA